MPQLTIRSALTGFLLGGVLAATALYIGAKTGITHRRGAHFGDPRLRACTASCTASGIAEDFTILENNCTQSIATAAGYMVAPMISSLAAYMLVTEQDHPVVAHDRLDVRGSVLGVLVAFPMKRRFINDEQLPFPEGRASGVVLDALYTGAAAAGMFKARLLGATARADGHLPVDHQRRLDEAPAVQDPAHGPVGWPEGAVDVPRAARHLLLRCGREGERLDPDDPRHRYPPARVCG